MNSTTPPVHYRAGRTAATVATEPSVKTLGFGFTPERGEHHFLVSLPKKEDGHAIISEHLNWDESSARRELSLALGREDDKVRILLPLRKWHAIADALQTEFNQRLKKLALPAARWTKTTTTVSRLLGKEMTLLAWAIEEADPALIPAAIRNWQGLAPEERWWLYTMTNAATGHAINGRNKGWRKAVRFALTENPSTAGDAIAPREEFYGLIRESPGAV